MNANESRSKFLTGEEVHCRRLRIGWSRERLAHEIGTTEQTIAAWENDNRPVTFPRAVEQVLKQAEKR